MADAGGPTTGSTFVTVLGTLEIGLIAAGGYFLSQLVGNPDNSNDLAKTLLPVTGILGGIVLLHTVLWYIYFTYNPLSMNLYFLVSTAFSMIISLTALSISLISRSQK
jgi:hypothetical protein